MNLPPIQSPSHSHCPFFSFQKQSDPGPSLVDDLSEGTDGDGELDELPPIVVSLNEELVKKKEQYNSLKANYKKNKALYDQKTALREKLDDELAKIAEALDAPELLEKCIKAMEESVRHYVVFP